MKNGGKKLNETLDNLIVESEQTCAPTADAVLALVRQEKTARSRRQAAAAQRGLGVAGAVIRPVPTFPSPQQRAHRMTQNPAQCRRSQKNRHPRHGLPSQ